MAGFTPLLLRAGMRPRSLWRQWRHPNARRVAVRTLLTLILVTLFAGSALAWHTSSAKAHSAASASSLQHLAASSQKSTISQQTVMNFAPWGWLSNPSQREWLSGDFNGDGQTDIVYLWDNNGYVEAYTAFAKGDGSFTVNGSSLAFGSETWGWISDPSQREWFVSDFNGDGQTDLAYLWDNNGYVEIYTAFSNGDGSFTTASAQPAFGSSRWGWISDPSQHEWLSGDFNGDGQTDLAYLWNNNGYVEAYTAFSKADGSFAVNGSAPAFGSSRWGWISDPSVHQWLSGDFNNDGQTDLAYLWDDNGYVEVYTAFSTGNGSFSTASAQPAFGSSRWGWISDPSLRQWFSGDFNGDGKTDLTYLWDNNGYVEVYTAFSKGNGSFTVNGSSLAFGSETWGWISDPSVHQWFASDFNGDGKTDLAYLWDNNGYVEVYTAFSNGAGSFSTASAAPGWAWLDPSNRYWLDGSFNGDGKTDLAYLWNNNGTVEVYSAFSSGAGTFAVAATQLAF